MSESTTETAPEADHGHFETPTVTPGAADKAQEDPSPSAAQSSEQVRSSVSGCVVSFPTLVYLNIFEVFSYCACARAVSCARVCLGMRA